MRAVVTGGTGFIGNAIVKRLLCDGWDVIIIDNLYDPVCRSIADGFNGTYRLINMDVVDIEGLQMDGIDIVFHFAAHYANVRSLEEPMLNVKTNMVGTMAVLEFCRKNNVKTLMYASSSGVYGNSEQLPFTENASICPSTPYEVTKYAGEILCSGYCKIYNISLVAPRFFNVYGPGDMPGGFRSAVPNFFKKALSGNELCITGDSISRDFTFIDDVVNGVLVGAKAAKGSFSQVEYIYNISTGDEVFILDLAKEIKLLTGSTSQIVLGGMRGWDNAPRRVGDNTKFKNLFPVAANNMRDIKTGLSDSLEWYKAVCK